VATFIDDPQYLALLSPETTDVWKCSAWDRAAHYLKLKYPEGEVDFIVTAAISSLPPVEKKIDLSGIRESSCQCRSASPTVAPVRTGCVDLDPDFAGGFLGLVFALTASRAISRQLNSST